MAIFGPQTVQFKGKIRKMSFPTGSASVELEFGNAKFNLIAVDQEAIALLYNRILTNLYGDSKRKDTIIIKDNRASETSSKGVRSLKNREVVVDAGFEIVFYDAP